LFFVLEILEYFKTSTANIHRRCVDRFPLAFPPGFKMSVAGRRRWHHIHPAIQQHKDNELC